MTNNTTSLTLPLFLFMINLNLPTMNRAHEHKKTTGHNWIPIRHNLWRNTHISIEKYQSIVKLDLTSNHSLQKQHTNYWRDRPWSFTYFLFYFMFKLSGEHRETSDHHWTPTSQSPLLSTYPNRSGWSNQRPQSTVNQYHLGASLMSYIGKNEDTTTVHKKTMIKSFLIIYNFSLYECIM